MLVRARAAGVGAVRGVGPSSGAVGSGGGVLAQVAVAGDMWAHNITLQHFESPCRFLPTCQVVCSSGARSVRGRQILVALFDASVGFPTSRTSCLPWVGAERVSCATLRCDLVVAWWSCASRCLIGLHRRLNACLPLYRDQATLRASMGPRCTTSCCARPGWSSSARASAMERLGNIVCSRSGRR